MTGLIKDFPGFKNLYYMEEIPGNRWFYADLEDHPVHFELMRGEWIPDEPLKTYWSMGRAEPDEISRGCGVSWFYLNSRVQQLFRDHNLTGWSTYPMVLHNKAGKVCEGYAGLCVTGRCGAIDKQRSKLAPGETSNKQFPLRVGIYFEESSWDGSDFCCPEGVNAYMFVTEKVRNLFGSIPISS